AKPSSTQSRLLVWVKIHNVPVVAFSETVMESIVVTISLPKGKGNYLESLDVEYEWWPPRCSKCKIFDHVDEGYSSRVKKIYSESLSRETDVQNACIYKKKVSNKATKSKQGLRFYKTKSNLIYRHVSKPSTSFGNTSNLNTKAPSIVSKVVDEAAIEPNVSHKVSMNDPSSSTNENGYFEDDINFDQLRSNIEKLMDENTILELNTNLNKDDVIDTLKSACNINEESTTTKSIHAKVTGVKKGSLLEHFLESRKASKSKINARSNSNESEVEEVCMPNGGFLNDLEDDLDCYDGYEAQVFDLTEQDQAICDRYDIRLN
nr:hypothetical protein [Tanacetum cinerariifolium]